MSEAATPTGEAPNPGILDRVRARFGWFDHAIRAYQRFDGRHGFLLAAGLTYYTVFAVFPLLMIVFAGVGFALFLQPELLTTIDTKIRSSVSGELAQQLVDLMNSAIASRTSVGVIGLAGALWVGLSWMWHLREALSEMWEQRVEALGFLRTKMSDLLAMLSAFVVAFATIALSALGHARPMAKVLTWFGIHDFPAWGLILRLVSLLISLLVGWVFFTWMIARLPREPIRFGTSMRAGLIAAIGFEVFKQVASIYLAIVLRGPAGVTFGPVLGLMVFAYVTACLILLATAWAATSPENLHTAPVDPPGPAVITPRAQLDEGLRARQVLAAVAVGAVGVLGISRLIRRGRQG